MTVIVGLEHEGKVYIGGDSAGCAGHSLSVRADEKVFVNQGIAFGFTSSFRMGQLLRYSFKPPYQLPTQTDYEFLTTTFIDAVRKCLKDGGFARSKEEVESGGTFLIGYRGKLYQVEDDFQVGRSVNGYDAVGCGADIALGAMHALSHEDVFDDPEDAIEGALLAAQEFSAYVRAPFVTVSS